MHRVLLNIHGFEIYSYAVMMVIAFLISLFWLQKRGKKAGCPPEVPVDFAFFLVIGGILGARLAYVVMHIPYYQQHLLESINLRAGGLSWHGALIGGIIAALLFARSRKFNLWVLLDLTAPVQMLGLSIGRIGCFLNGCCYGRECAPGWGFIFKEDGFTTPRYPTQLYEMVLIWLSIPILLFWEKKTKFKGELFLASIVLYSVVRFVVEIFRDSVYVFPGITQAQLFSIIAIVVILPYILIRRSSSK